MSCFPELRAMLNSLRLDTSHQPAAVPLTVSPAALEVSTQIIDDLRTQNLLGGIVLNLLNAIFLHDFHRHALEVDWQPPLQLVGAHA
jgi:hypothetical protein